MSQKAHGTTELPVLAELRYGCDVETADRICCFNRHYAEHKGYAKGTRWLETVDPTAVTTYYDSVSGKPLFRAPIGRTFEEFKAESIAHGWPSFRDPEVVWEHMRVLPNGEACSDVGTHLGHNLPDRSGNRYCINLVSVAGSPIEGGAEPPRAGAFAHSLGRSAGAVGGGGGGGGGGAGGGGGGGGGWQAQLDGAMKRGSSKASSIASSGGS